MKTQIMSSLGEGARPVDALVGLLRDELTSHDTLLHLERQKREAILARNGKTLKEIATAQAAELHKIELLDSQREKAVRKIMAADISGEIRLRDVIESPSVSSTQKAELSKYHTALNLALAELKTLSEGNTKMLVDNRNLFKKMIEGLAGRQGENSTHGFFTADTTPKAQTKASLRPVLIDAAC